jgi:hypothetical protein
MKIFNARGQPIAIIDHSKLHSFIINKISREFSNLVENCYYPKISEIYKDLLHLTSASETELKTYAKQKYSGKLAKYKLLHDPQTTLQILIIQDFLRNKDLAAAAAAFHLFALRQYTNLLHRYTTPPGSRQQICKPDIFQSALEQLSKNHMYSRQKTISGSIIYYSNEMFKRYLTALKEDDADGIHSLIYAIRTRMNQTMRSFFNKYYEINKNKDQMVKSKEEVEYDETHETKLRNYVNKISKDICIYANVNREAATQASELIKFNKMLSERYAVEMSQTKYINDIELAIYLLLKDLKDISFIKSVKFLDYVKKLMAIKVTKQTVYFKKSVTNIHDEIIRSLKLTKWFNNLSTQSKAISRNFVAFYLAFYIRSYL